MRKKTKVYVIILLLLFMAASIYMIFLYTNKHEGETLDNQYFSITAPNGWSIKSKSDDIFNKLLYNQEEIISIEVFPKWEFGNSIDSIVANIYGVHSYINDIQYTKNLNKTLLTKVSISFEQSAAEEHNNTQSDQLHYFYINNDMVIDFYVVSSSIGENIIDNIAESLRLKK